MYSYYEFIQPDDQRLTDDAWRQILAGPDKPELPSWATYFVLSGGLPSRWLFFRSGDVYDITPAGNHLNVYEQPSTGSKVLAQLQSGDAIDIIEGPVVNGQTWWKIQCDMCFRSGNDLFQVSGWSVEQQDWYSRATMNGP